MPFFSRNDKTPLGIYIHIPFCAQKCRYCDFYSFPKGDEYFEIYKNRVMRDGYRDLIPLCDCYLLDEAEVMTEKLQIVLAN